MGSSRHSAVDLAKKVENTKQALVTEVISVSGGVFDDTDRQYLNAMSTEELQRWRKRLAGSLTASPIIGR